MAGLDFYCVYFTTIRTFLSYENVPSHRRGSGKLSPRVNVPTPSPQGNADPSEMGEHLSYFQLFPGQGAHYITRQSFPVSQNPDILGRRPSPRHLKRIFLGQQVLCQAPTPHTLQGSHYITPSFRARAPRTRLASGLREPLETSSQAPLSPACGTHIAAFCLPSSPWRAGPWALVGESALICPSVWGVACWAPRASSSRFSTCTLLGKVFC